MRLSSLLIFCVDDVSIVNSDVLKSPAATVLESVSSSKSNRISYRYLDGFVLGAYIFLVVMSSFFMDPLIDISFFVSL